MNPAIQRALAADPQGTLNTLQALDAEEHLIDLVPVVWDVIEPGRKFIPGYAIEAICDHLEAVTRGEIKRLVMNVPPGCMKSLTTQVLWPIWEWGPMNMPWLRYVRASYSDALTTRDNIRARRIIQSDVFQAHWGERFHLMADQNAKMKFENNHTGFMIATSVGGLGTGERGDRFVIDDPHNIKDGESTAKREDALRWFSNVVPTRINDPESSAIICIMQRVHDRDVSGLILKEELGYDWLCLPMEYEKKHRCFTPVKRFADQEPEEVCSYRRETEPIPRWLTRDQLAHELQESPPAHEFIPKWQHLYTQDWRNEEGELLWPERFTKRHLEKELKPQLRAFGGTFAEAGQLQQRPAPRAGGNFQRGDFHMLEEMPKDIIRTVRGWDLAGKKKKTSAWTVGLRMHICESGMVLISDVWRFKETPHGVDKGIRMMAELDGFQAEASIPQDPGQAGVHQVSHLATVMAGYNVHFSPESGDKEDRAGPLASQAEAGNLYLMRRHWNDALIDEFTIFPNSDFKDQVDAASRAYMRLTMTKEMLVGMAPVIIGQGGGA